MSRPFQLENWAERLHVIAVISNPRRYRTRYDLYEDFSERMAAAGAVLWTVEVAYGDRSFAVTTPDNPGDIQLRTNAELWHKENMINLGIQRLPEDARYIAWVDADVQFIRLDWAEETIHMLQHHPIVQLWSEAIDLTPQHECLMRHRSFAWCYHHVHPEHCHKYQPPKPVDRCYLWHPGFAWAARRETLTTLGGLIDIGILGAGDNHMAKGLIGDARFSYHPKINANYKAIVDQWGSHAVAKLNRDVGYVDGLLLHHWHGPKKARQYWDRWKILVNNDFDPLTDISRDLSGLYQLTGKKYKLRDEIRGYMSQRNEDSIDVDPTEIKI